MNNRLKDNVIPHGVITEHIYKTPWVALSRGVKGLSGIT